MSSARWNASPNGAPASPLVRAGYRLARAFGWTPQQLQTMTLGQVALYLEMLDADEEA